MVGSTQYTITRYHVYQVLGKFLLSTGIVIACMLGLHLVREELDRQVLASSPILLAEQPLESQLPLATALPTTTPTPQPSSTPLPTATVTYTPLPTSTPFPLSPIRISIPAIHLNARISEISPTRRQVAGSTKFIWEPLPYAAAHFDSSGQPGEGTNIVLLGHNNTLGEVFRNLDKLNPGDNVILYTEAAEFHYQVQKKYLIPYLGVEAEADAILQSYSAPTPSETLTLISCWPYLTNANRIVVQAVPFPEGGSDGQ